MGFLDRGFGMKGGKELEVDLEGKLEIASSNARQPFRMLGVLRKEPTLLPLDARPGHLSGVNQC